MTPDAERGQRFSFSGVRIVGVCRLLIGVLLVVSGGVRLIGALN